MEDLKHLPGTYIVVQNLVKSPEMNGKVAEVKGEGKEGRIMVRLVEESHRLLNMKEANLRQAEDSEVEAALRAEFESLSDADITKVLVEAGVRYTNGVDNKVDLAVTNKLFPEVPKRVTNFTNFDPEEEVDIPGSGPMKRRDMWEQADRLEKLTVAQMREQVRVFKSRSLQELKQMNPAMRNLTESDVQMQLAQFETFLNNPNMKKIQIDALRTGDFSKLNSASALQGMDDDSMRRDARMKLEAFKKNPAEFRAQFLQSAEFASLSDSEIEDQLRTQATADSKTLKALRQGGAGMDLSSLSDEQLKKNSELQLKMFNDNPKQTRQRMEQQNPQLKNMTDDQLRMQLETVASMSPADIRAMQSMNAQGMAQGLDPNDPQQSLDKLNDMSPEQLSAMFKMQRNMFRQDPIKFKQAMPQFANMPDSMIGAQLDTMADMDPQHLKWYLNATGSITPWINRIREPLDRISGGYGTHILSLLALLLVLLVMYFLVGFLWRMLGWVFPTTFGSSLGKAQVKEAMGSAQGGDFTAPVQQVDLDVEDDDAFFQQDDL